MKTRNLVPGGWVLAIGLMLMAPASVLAERVTDPRHLVFEKSDERGLPEWDGSYFGGGLRLEAYFARVANNYHFPYDLFLRYEDCDCYALDTVNLVFTLMARDQAGLEWDGDAGVRGKVILGGNFKLTLNTGADYEENFIPPFTNEIRHFESLEIGFIPPSKILCLFGADVGIGKKYDYNAGPQRVRLRITEPTETYLAKFQETNDQVCELVLDTANGENRCSDTVRLIIGPYIGEIRIEAAVDPVFKLVKEYSYGLGGGVTIGCFLGFDTSTVTGGILPRRDTVDLEMDKEESESLSWTLFSYEAPCPSALREWQDLIPSSYRVSGSEYPHLGATDSLVTVIRNVHPGLCQPYSAVEVTYFLDAGVGRVQIGSHVLTPANSDLSAFNSGVQDSLLVRFAFDPANPSYIFTADHKWLLGDDHPFYKVAINPIPQLTAPPECSSWVVLSALGLGASNDTATVPFRRPLPDFSVDSVYLGEAPASENLFVQPGDVVPLDVSVLNRGMSWPVDSTMDERKDSVFLDCRIGYERRVGGQWVEMHHEYLGRHLVTPMTSQQRDSYHLTYTVPELTSLAPYEPIDQVRIRFEVNGGDTLSDTVMWEHSFLNNDPAFELQFSDVVDCAIPSDSLHASGEVIAPDLPDVDLLGACPQWLYLYLRDAPFDTLPSGTEPGGLRVQIGIGAVGSRPLDSLKAYTEGLPKDSVWRWFDCDFIGDFADAIGKLYKQYRVDACTLLAGTSLAFTYSYCFRVSKDWQDEWPSYRLVDRDGVWDDVDVDSSHNLFRTSNTGTATRNEARIVVAPAAFEELHVTPTGTEEVFVIVENVGAATLDYHLTVQPDGGGVLHILIEGGSSYSNFIPVGAGPDTIGIQFDGVGESDPSEHDWRVAVTSNDPINDPGQGGVPLSIDLNVFVSSVWYSCTRDTISTGSHRLAVGSCLELGNQGIGGGLWAYGSATEWIFDASPILAWNDGSSNIVYRDIFWTTVTDRGREANQAYRAQSDLSVNRSTTINGHSAQVASGRATSTDSIFRLDYEVITFTEPGMTHGAIMVYTLTSHRQSGLYTGLHIGAAADLRLDSTYVTNDGIASASDQYVGGRGGYRAGGTGEYVPWPAYAALFSIPLDLACQDEAAGGQVLDNADYVYPEAAYNTDTLYNWMAGLSAWSANTYAPDTITDLSVIMGIAKNRNLGPLDTIRFAIGLAVSDVDEGDLRASVATLRQAYNDSCGACPISLAGDVNESGTLSSADIIALVNYVFKSGVPPEPCAANGDVNCNGSVSSADIIYMVGHVFKGGSAPCDICNEPGAMPCMP